MNYISFLDDEENDKFIKNESSSLLCLCNNSSEIEILKYIPRKFKITTQDSSALFNIDILKDTSATIRDFVLKNPESFQYHIDIKDEENVLSKFEKLYLGDQVFFDEEELPISKKITKSLEITECYNYMKPESLKYSNKCYENLLKNGVSINKSSFKSFLINYPNKQFTIKTKNHEYKCNFFGVYFSKILCENLIENPTLDGYNYDYEDKFNEFQNICDLFNFSTVKITINNVHSIQQISKELRIDSILNKLDKFIDEYEELSLKIDEQQIIVDSIEELFDQLLNIKNNSIENVKNFIVESNWVNSEEEVHELAAFILQVSKIDSSYHPYLADLLCQLEKESNEITNLKYLNPFLINKLIQKFGSKMINCSFIYYLYNRKLIPKEKIINNILSCENVIVAWFFTELIELKKININDFIPKFYQNNRFVNWKIYLAIIYQNKLEMYNQMRDNCEPDDPLTKSIRNDDVDTFQSIVSQGKNNLSTQKIPHNIFDNFVQCGVTNYINYAAAYGAIKCFKYLLLNHVKIDNDTAKYAVFGGNVEIIKIIDQQNDKAFQLNKDKNNPLYISIMKHENDLFDWILENKITQIRTIQTFAFELLYNSIKFGNAHSFIEIINKGIDFSQYYDKLIEKSSKKGFFKLFQLIEKLFNANENSKKKVASIYSFSSFGNLSIFKMSLQLPYNQINYEKVFQESVKNNYFNIIQFFFDYIAIEKGFKFTSNLAFASLNESIDKNLNELFKYLIEKFSVINKCLINDCNELNNLLIKTCSMKNTESSKILINLIAENSPYQDFSKSFKEAIKINSFELCKLFIDSKVIIDYNQIINDTNGLGSIDKDLFIFIINNCNACDKSLLINCFLYPAIEKQNVKLVEYLLNQNAEYEDALIKAVEINNNEIVDIILKHNSKPYFINKKSAKGTAILIAVNNNNMQIIQNLLSIKGINLNLYDDKGITPLMKAISSLNLEITNLILDFYGDEIESQKRQLDKALVMLLDSLGVKRDLIKIKFEKKNDQKVIEILKRILEIKIIDPNCHGIKYSLLSFACEIDDINIVKMLLDKKDADVNLCSKYDGATPLIVAVSCFNRDIAELLIKDQRTDINARDYNGKTALTQSAEYGQYEIVDLLINNEKFDPKESFLDYAFLLSSDKAFDSLYSIDGLDVNYQGRRNKYIDTKLIKAINYKDSHEFDMIINHPSFDKDRSLINHALYWSIKLSGIDFFRKLLDLDDNVEKYRVFKNRTLLGYSIAKCKKEFMFEILNNSKYKHEKNDFLDSFQIGLMKIGKKKEIIDLLKDFLKYDQQHDHFIDLNQCLPNGETYLTLNKMPENVGKYISFLIENGANPNVPNKFNIFPLEKAIEDYSYDLSRALIDTNQIDFKMLIPNKQRTNKNDSVFKTYIQIAAKNENQPDFFWFFIKDNNIDVNVVDDKGENALMEACRNLSAYNVRVLFNIDDLDYLHRNNDGEDAIDIVLKMANATLKNPRHLNKNEYLMTLLYYLSEIFKNEKCKNKEHRQDHSSDGDYDGDYDEDADGDSIEYY